MMEGLQSLPPSLHAELLNQLTAIALVSLVDHTLCYSMYRVY